MGNQKNSLEATCASEVCNYRGKDVCSFKQGEYCPMYTERKADEELKKDATEEAKPKQENAGSEVKVPALTREKVTIFATLDEDMLKAINEAGATYGNTMVRLEERVIDDFIAAKTAPSPEKQEVNELERFIRDDNNRAKAESDAKKLYSLLTQDPIEKFAGKRFTRKDIVKRTTLSNSGALAELAMLAAFGFVRYTGGKMEEFEFEFRPEQIHATVRRQVLAMMTEVAKDYTRYKALIEQDKTLNKKQRDHEIAALKAEFRKLLA